MSMLVRRLLLLLPWRRRAIERDMQDELRSLAAMAEPGELGNLTLAAEDARAEWGWTWLEQTAQDLRYGVRTLGKAPGFTVAAVLSLAIGIGANTALFTLINTVMWKLLPVSDPEHLLTLEQQTPLGITQGSPPTSSTRSSGIPVPGWISRHPRRGWTSASTAETEPATDGQLVTGHYFPLLVTAGRRPISSTRPTIASSGIRSPCSAIRSGNAGLPGTGRWSVAR